MRGLACEHGAMENNHLRVKLARVTMDPDILEKPRMAPADMTPVRPVLTKG